MFPELFVNLYEASLRIDLENIAQLRQKVAMLYRTVYNVGNYSSRITKGTKCGLSVMGICNDYMAPPFHKFNSVEREQIEKYIEEIALIK